MTTSLPLRRGSLIVLCALATLTFQHSGGAQSGPNITDPLPYALSFTVTGDYATGSVDFRPRPNSTGFQTEVLPMRDDSKTDKRIVPAGANIVAAYLYWETIWRTPSEVV